MHETLDLMTTSCPSQINQLRQPRGLLLQLLDPRPTQNWFSSKWDEGRSEKRQKDKKRWRKRGNGRKFCQKRRKREKFINSLTRAMVRQSDTCEGLTSMAGVDVCVCVVVVRRQKEKKSFYVIVQNISFVTWPSITNLCSFSQPSFLALLMPCITSPPALYYLLSSH